jgi:vacuolar iron transporter family protein
LRRERWPWFDLRHRVVSGATLGNSHFVVIAGLAGMVASALSMASGAYLAAKSEREIYEAEFAREKEAVEDNEAEAREVLSLSYQIRGLPEADAVRFVNTLRRTKSNSSGHSRESD